MTHRIRLVRRVTSVAATVAIGCVLVAGTAATASASSDPDPVGVWPLRPDPDVVKAFDPPSSPYAAGHRGVDLGGTPGQRVLASLPGTVTYAGPLAGRGIVVVSHGATRTTYQPVTATVSVGDDVQAGGPVGRLEIAGSHCLPRACLHWGWIEGETYLDPLRLVGFGPVRLLPLWRDLPEPTAVGPPLPSRPAIPYDSWQPLLRLLHPFGTA